VSACPVTTSNFTQSASFTCTGSPLACTESPLSAPMPDTNRNAGTTTTGLNNFTAVAVQADSTGTTPAARARRMNVPADASAYDSGRLSQADLTDVTSTTATVARAVTGNQATASNAASILKYPTTHEKTVPSTTP